MAALRLGQAASVARPDEAVGVQVEVDDLRSEGIQCLLLERTSERERDGINRTTYFELLEVGVLHDLMFEIVLRNVSPVLNEIEP